MKKEDVENYMSVSLGNYFNQMMNYLESTWKIKKVKEAVGVWKEKLYYKKSNFPLQQKSSSGTNL